MAESIEEVWKQIEEFPDYKISTLGRVISCKNGKEAYKTPQINDCNYYVLGLYHNRKQTSCRIHRLMAKAFIPNPDNLPTVDHIDRNRQNNTISNLRWATTYTQLMNRSNTRLDVEETDPVLRHRIICKDNKQKAKDNKDWYCKPCDKAFFSKDHLIRHETKSKTHLKKINSASK
tara:strand:- start:218 stop:742 length:525 start_codon:yes stop_codon:yes gene_type:complete